MARCRIDATTGRNSAYPNFNLPYRGLPTEIRMLIWHYAIGTRVISIRRSPFTQDYGNYYHWDENFIDNIHDFNFSILLLNKEVILEVMEIAKTKLTWSFATSHYGHILPYLLGHLSPLQKQMVGEISIASASLMNSAEFTRIHWRLALTEPYDLTIRLSPPDIPHRSLILCGGIGQYPSSEVEVQLSEELRYVFWYAENARMVYRLLNDENVETFKLEYYQAYEELRPYFSNPVRVLFDNQRFRYYLSVSQVDRLQVELDWPINSKLLSVRISKKVREQRQGSVRYSN